MAKPTMSQQIEELKRCLNSERRGYEVVSKENKEIKLRLSQIAAENEELRLDKKWLKVLVQNLIGASNALSR